MIIKDFILNKLTLRYFLLSISIYLCFPNFSLAENYLVVEYISKDGDSINSIILPFFKPGIPPSNLDESLAQTTKNNPEIKNWDQLTAGQKIKIYLDPSIADLKKYHAYYENGRELNAHHFVVFSMPSIGYFSQSNNSGYSLTYKQISLLSLGCGYLYAPPKNSLNLSSSFYYSTISATTNNVSNASNGGSSSVQIPGEYGGNIYAIFKQKLEKFSFYSGIDIENFSSFNIENILNQDNIIIDTNTLIYLTGGLNFNPVAIDNLEFKFSLSKSILSNYSSTLTTSQKITLSGIKTLLFINYKLNPKWSINSMFKAHYFSGDNDLSINRFGMGITYTIN